MFIEVRLGTSSVIRIICWSTAFAAIAGCNQEPLNQPPSPSKTRAQSFKPRTPIDFFCEGFARASAHGIRPDSILASTAHFATKMGGPAVARDAKKWATTTEKGLLAEIKRSGNPRICQRFSEFLTRTDMLAKRAAKKRAEEGRAQIPIQPKKPCDALEVCCKAIPSASKTLKANCFRTLSSAKDVQQVAWCREGLERFRKACTGTQP